jgi:hypothetical protein
MFSPKIVPRFQQELVTNLRSLPIVQRVHRAVEFLNSNATFTTT